MCAGACVFLQESIPYACNVWTLGYTQGMESNKQHGASQSASLVDSKFIGVNAQFEGLMAHAQILLDDFRKFGDQDDLERALRLEAQANRLKADYEGRGRK